MAHIYGRCATGEGGLDEGEGWAFFSGAAVVAARDLIQGPNARPVGEDSAVLGLAPTEWVAY